jgi:arabinogalactan oligomer/maltooligosaccharide transport system permease protein
MKFSSILRYSVLAIFNAGSIYLIPLIVTFESWFLLTVLVFVTFLINFTYLTDKFAALKWITPGVIFMFSFVVFPAAYNTYVSFTNWSTGHILTKSQAIELLEARTYTPDDQKGVEFDIYIFENNTDEYYFAADLAQDQLLFGKAVTQDEIDKASYATHEPSLKSESGEIVTPDGLKLLAGKDQINKANKLQELSLVIDSSTRAQLYKISVFGSSTGRLLSTSQRYTYESEYDSLIDNSTGEVCSSDGDNFVCNTESVDPGWRIFVGSENYKKLFSNQRIRGPLELVTKWTFQFATLTVLLAFTVGLLLSITLNKEKLKFKRIYRALYILPYAIPAFVSVLVWKGLLNPDYGVINNWLDPLYTFFDIEPIKWLKTKESARAAVLLVNTWLGFPYMFLITTGALQSIPKELTEAAKVDGASGVQSFWRITFPLLMVSISPLLIGSFAFNFNNFTLIFLLSGGGPPVIGSEVAVGWTDILISFSYRLAISGGRGNLFGLASSVTIIIFGIVLLISAISFRYTKRLERIYGNI